MIEYKRGGECRRKYTARPLPWFIVALFAIPKNPLSYDVPANLTPVNHNPLRLMNS